MKQLFYVFILIITSSGIFAQVVEGDDNCFRCHGMKTLSKRTSENGVIKSYTIDKLQLKESHHGEMSCVDCHSEDFEKFPHSKDSYESMSCEDCHDEDLEIKGQVYSEINSAMAESVHGEAEMKCSDCHNPHTFAMKTSLEPLTQKLVSKSNHACFDCHIIGIENESIIAVHSWGDLDSQVAESINCIDCHADKNTAVSLHKIFSKK